jgi:hypothetical protein
MVRRDGEGCVSAPLLLLVGCIYLGVGLDYYRQGRYGMVLTMVAYSIANIGLILDGLKR